MARGVRETPGEGKHGPPPGESESAGCGVGLDPPVLCGTQSPSADHERTTTNGGLASGKRCFKFGRGAYQDQFGNEVDAIIATRREFEEVVKP